MAVNKPQDTELDSLRSIDAILKSSTAYTKVLEEINKHKGLSGKLDIAAQRSGEKTNKLAIEYEISVKAIGIAESEGLRRKYMLSKKQYELDSILIKKHAEMLSITSQINTELGEAASAFSGGVLTTFMQVFKFFGGIQTAAQGLRNELGYTKDIMPDIEDDIKTIAVDLAKIGATTESTVASFKAIYDISGIMTKDMSSLAKDSVIFKQTMGVSEQSTSAVYEKLGAMADASESTLRNTMLNTQEFAKAAGTSLPKVMSDVAKASGEVVSSMRGNVRELIKGAVVARRLGLDIGQVAGAMRQVLTFNQNINDEMEMSVLLGRNFNFIALRKAAWEGDAVKTAEEQVRLLKEMGGIQGKNMYQIDSMAKSLGLSVEALQKMSFQEELLKKASPEVNKRFAEYLRMKDKSVDLTKMDIKEADKRLQLQIEENNLQNDFTQMQNSLKAATLSIYNLLSPIINLTVKAVNLMTTWGAGTSSAWKTITSVAVLYITKMTMLGVLHKTVFGTSFSKLLAEAGKGYNKFLKNILGIKIPKTKTSIGGSGDMFDSIIKSVKKINFKTMAGGALIMISFAGAIWIMSDAAEKFAKTGDNFNKAMMGIIISSAMLIVGVVAIISALALLDGAWEIVLAGSVLLLSFGASLWLVSEAAQGFSKAMDGFFDGLIKIKDVNLSNIASGIFSLGWAFAKLSLVGVGVVLGATSIATGMYLITESLRELNEELSKAIENKSKFVEGIVSATSTSGNVGGQSELINAINNINATIRASDTSGAVMAMVDVLNKGIRIVDMDTALLTKQIIYNTSTENGVTFRSGLKLRR